MYKIFTDSNKNLPVEFKEENSRGEFLSMDEETRHIIGVNDAKKKVEEFSLRRFINFTHIETW